MNFSEPGFWDERYRANRMPWEKRIFLGVLFFIA